MRIKVFDEAGAFGGDKDAAARLRDKQLKPALKREPHKTVTLDFRGVDFATQSFIHALLSAVVRKDPTDLDRLRFVNCSGSVREIVEIVVQYSQEDLGDATAQEPADPKRRRRKGT